MSFLRGLLGRKSGFALSPLDKRAELSFAMNAQDPDHPLSPIAFYDEVLHLVHEHSLFDTRTYRDRAEALRADFNTIEEAALAAREALTALGDEYTRLLDAGQAAGRWQHHPAGNMMMPGSVGYLLIRTFADEDVVARTRAGLKKLADASALVLDLRPNKGGCLRRTLMVYELLADGDFLRIQGRKGEERYYLTDSEAVCSVALDGSLTTRWRTGNLTGTKPLVVLVSEKTTSMAVHLARALRQNRGAKIVGMPTHSKDTFQRHFPLAGGASLSVTDGRVALADRYGPNGVVVRPDYEVPRRALSNDRQLFVAQQIAWSMYAVDKMANGNAAIKDAFAAFDHIYSNIEEDVRLSPVSMQSSAATRIVAEVERIERNMHVDILLEETEDHSQIQFCVQAPREDGGYDQLGLIYPKFLVSPTELAYGTSRRGDTHDGKN